jgi:hypothetical protein
MRVVVVRLRLFDGPLWRCLLREAKNSTEARTCGAETLCLSNRRRGFEAHL